MDTDELVMEDYASDSSGDSDQISDEELAEESQTLRPQHPYLQEDMHEKLEDISWERAIFVDTQALTAKAEAIENVDDDLQRELCFYNQALLATRTAVEKLEEAGVPWARPPDYFAEMVKSDGHMAKIKERLMHEQKSIEEADERRKQREAKRSSKELQAQRLKEKVQSRKSSIAKLDQLRKQRQRSGFAGDFDVETELAALDRPAPKNSGQRIIPGLRGISKKREAKNSRFGFGGRKRLQKQNDASSAANMNDFRSKGGRGRGGKSNKGQQRPGKSKRATMRHNR